MRDNSTRTYYERVVSLDETQARFIDIAQRNQLEVDRFYMARRETGNNISFPVVAYVLGSMKLRNHLSIVQTYRAMSSISSVYTLENLVTHNYTEFHVEILREFRIDPA